MWNDSLRSAATAIVAAAFIFLVPTGSTAMAALIPVNSTSDLLAAGDGSCTLREAIFNANLLLGGDLTGGDCSPGAPGLDTVALPAGSYSLSLLGASENGNFSGDLDVLDSLRLQGVGAAATEIFGLGADRILDIAPNSAAISVQIVELSLIGGVAPLPRVGGCVRIAAPVFASIQRSSVRDCRATRGGGVYNNGELIVENSTFLSNRTVGGDDGGGIYSDNSLIVILGGFEANRAEDRGGAIFAEGDLSVDGVGFVGNTADVRGGAIFERADTTIVNSEFQDNQALLDDGGAIHHAGVFLSLEQSALLQNGAAENGGGLFSEGNATVNECQVDGNQAKQGGGVYHDFGTIGIFETTLTSNIADERGGGLYNSAVLNLTGSEVQFNQSQLEGGGLYNVGETTINRSTVDENTSITERGGGAFTQVSLLVEHSTFSRNSAALRGGGIYNELSGSVVGLANSTLTTNFGNPDGAGVFNEGELAGSFVTVTRNQSGGGSGGGVVNANLALFKNSIVADNSGDCIALAPIGSAGFNLDSDSTCFGAGPADLTGLFPNLGPLQNNGGPTETHALLVPNPSIDTAEPACTTLAGAPVPVDQRFSPRPLDGDGNGTLICDRGAFEAPTFLPPIPPPVPNGIIGTPLLASRLNVPGTLIEVVWDVAQCPGVGYHLVYGPLSDVSAYTISGGVCAIAPTGSMIWNAVPAGSLYFLMLADDSSNVEGSWGFATGGVRNGLTPSGQCGMLTRDNGGVCP